MNIAKPLLILWLLIPVSAFAQRLSEVGPGYSQTSVNTTVFRNNSLVTHGDQQYIAYYDAQSRLTLGKRTLGTDQWEISTTQYTGNCADAHNVISIMVDGQGYLHVSFDHHGHPLRYCRGIAPGRYSWALSNP